MHRLALPLPAQSLVRRRKLLTTGAAAVATLALPALLSQSWAQSTLLALTPSQTGGPFYPLTLPADSDFDLLKNGSASYRHGQPTWVEGTVRDTAGKPVAGAVVEIWQCDHAGHYHHPGDGGRADPAFQGFGRVAVGLDGRYRFRTLKPAAYAGRTPHIHVKVRLDRKDLLTTQLYVAGDPDNERDFLWRRLSTDGRAALTAPFAAASDGLLAQFSLVVRA